MNNDQKDLARDIAIVCGAAVAALGCALAIVYVVVALFDNVAWLEPMHVVGALAALSVLSLLVARAISAGGERL